MNRRTILWMVAVLLVFAAAVSRLDAGRQAEDRQQLEEILRRTAVSCYAAEGFYPPDVAYMKENYALQLDETAYTIHYELFASNLMPEITVLENAYE